MTDYTQTKVSFREMLTFLIDKGYEAMIESWCVTNKEFNERVEMLYNALNCNNVDMTHWRDPKTEKSENGLSGALQFVAELQKKYDDLENEVIRVYELVINLGDGIVPQQLMYDNSYLSEIAERLLKLKNK